MTIGILKLTIFIHDSNSLKEKRMVLHSLKAKIHNSFNVAVTQIDEEDKWQMAILAIVGVERDRKTINSTLSKISDFIKESRHIDLINEEMEVI
jgi:hypothetical protein